MTQVDVAAAQTKIEAGTDDIDAVLREIWQELLHLPVIQPNEDFFEIGGDSLLAIRLLESIGRKFGDELLEPDIIYTASRFSDLAAAIRKSLSSVSQ